MRKTISGPFIVQNLGAASWRITAIRIESDGAAGSATADMIHLRGAGAAAPEILQDSGITGLSLEWHEDGVRIAVNGASGVRHLAARTAVVHEPQPRLYASLPLAGFDADAQRFWRRVFGLIRIPGGRLLLKFIARRSRPKRARHEVGPASH